MPTVAERRGLLGLATLLTRCALEDSMHGVGSDAAHFAYRDLVRCFGRAEVALGASQYDPFDTSDLPPSLQDVRASVRALLRLIRAERGGASSIPVCRCRGRVRQGGRRGRQGHARSIRRTSACGEFIARKRRNARRNGRAS